MRFLENWPGVAAQTAKSYLRRDPPRGAGSANGKSRARKQPAGVRKLKLSEDKQLFCQPLAFAGKETFPARGRYRAARRLLEMRS